MASKSPAKASASKAELVVLPAAAPDGKALMTEAITVCESVIVTTIDSPMMYELAAAELVDLQATYKKLEDQRFGITRPMDAAKKAVMDLFKSPLERVAEKILSVKAAMLEYDREEKRKAAVKQQLLDKIAADQRRALAEEQARQAAEAQAQHERAQQLLESGNTEGVDEALSKAEAAHEMAVALAETTQVVSAATAATNVPTVAGITTADVWKARVTDLPALLRFIAERPEYHNWVELKMTGLHDMAKAQRDALRIPGVEAFEEARIAASRTAKAA